MRRWAHTYKMPPSRLPLAPCSLPPPLVAGASSEKMALYCITTSKRCRRYTSVNRLSSSSGGGGEGAGHVRAAHAVEDLCAPAALSNLH